jgi:hypothetical protein
MRRVRQSALILSMAIAVLPLVLAGCRRPLPETGPISGTSKTLTVTGTYASIPIASVDRLTIDNGRLVVHAERGETAVDLPAVADPDQKGRGWALVTEGEDDVARTLTFTHESSLDDFTIQVPNTAGQIEYGSLGGRDGSDVLVFAYGSGSKSYWGWVTIRKKGDAVEGR